MFGLGSQELILILIIVLFLFGAKKLPELSRSLGQSMKELRKGLSDGDKDQSGEDKKASTPRKS